MKGIYIKSPYIKEDSNGRISGIVILQDLNGQRKIRLLGSFTRFPYKGDIIEANDITCETHPRYGEQFKAKSVANVSYPVGNYEQMRKYISHVIFANPIPGMGVVRKEEFFKLIDDDVWDMMRSAPCEWHSRFEKINSDHKQTIHERFARFEKSNAPLNANVDKALQVATLLNRIGLQWTRQHEENLTQFIVSCSSIHENKSLSAEDVLRKHILDLQGNSIIGIRKVLELAVALECDGHTIDNIHALNILYTNEENGNTCICIDEFTSECNRLELDVDIQQLIHRLVEMKLIHYDTEEELLFLKQTWIAESGTASMLKYRMTRERNYELSKLVADAYISELNDEGYYTDKQIQAIQNALRHRVSVVTGGPGTGKTTAMGGLLTVLQKADLMQNVVMLAPTGKAVSRLKHEVERNKYNGVRISTIHRFIAVNSISSVTLKSSPCNIYILDEASMIDVKLLYTCLNMIESDAHIIFVGDPDQLPSISAGNVLTDLIRSNIFPHVHLDVVKRNSGRLLNAINTIREGNVPRYKLNSDYERIIEQELTLIDKAVADIAKKYVNNPSRLLVITPKNATVQRLQQRLRRILNPNREVIMLRNGFEYTFSVGDRVIQTKNVYNTQKEVQGTEVNEVNEVNKANEGKTVERFNGMTGTVTKIKIKDISSHEVIINGEKRIVEEPDKSYVIVHFDNNEEQRYSLDEARHELQHAYVLTVHKSQGSEANDVVVVLEDYGISSGHAPPFMYRNLLYTAVSRARDKCIVVGPSESVRYAIEHDTPLRKTKLSDYLMKM